VRSRLPSHALTSALAGLLATATIGCARTWGAPEDDLGGAASAGEAMEEVQEEEAEESINR